MATKLASAIAVYRLERIRNPGESTPNTFERFGYEFLKRTLPQKPATRIFTTNDMYTIPIHLA
jgi:hypothetical protein